jgi:uncharacterized delta-60 repeat protein
MKRFILTITTALFTVLGFTQVSLDSTFGNNGVVRTPIFPDNLLINSIAFQNDSSIIAAGYTFSLQYKFKIIKYFPNGLIDISFGANGIATIPNQGIPEDILVQNDGKIVVAGYTNDSPPQNITMRFLPNGILDSSFGANGIVQVNLSSSTNDGISGMTIQSDGKIVAGGWSDGKFLVMRFLENGILDSSFGLNGIVLTTLEAISSIWSIEIQNDGKIVAAGATEVNSGVNPKFALARYNTDGGLDNTFGLAGKVIIDVNTSFEDFASSLIIQPDGKIVAAGTNSARCVIIKLNTDGSLDNNFAINGIFTDNSILSIEDIALQPNGKILAVATGSPIKIYRFNQDGSKDFGFGNLGIVTFDIANAGESSKSLEIQPDGKIILGGSAKETSNPSEGLLVRFNNDIETNVNESHEFNNKLFVFPNPANDWITIYPADKQLSGKVKVEIFDLMGKQVISDTKTPSENKINLNISILKNGIYLLRLTFQDGTSEVFKVSVNK